MAGASLAYVWNPEIKTNAEPIKTGFKRLSLEGLSVVKVKNPVLKMLLEEKEGKATDSQALIKPEDEWLIFPD